MPETTQEPEQSEVTTEAAISEKMDGKAPNSSFALKFWVTIAVLVSVVSLIGAGYLAYRLELQIVPQFDSDVLKSDAIEEQFAKSLQSYETLSAQIDGWDQELKEQIQSQISALKSMEISSRASDAELKERIDNVVESVSSIYQNLERDSDNWKLEELIYLLLMGNQRLQISGDVDSALVIWQVVDDQLKQNSDPRLQAVKTAINEEIIQLKDLEQVDVATLANQLLQLTESIESLPLDTTMSIASVDVAVNAEEDTQQPDESDSFWSGMLDEAWQDLKSLVRVRKIDDIALLPLKPDMKLYFAETLKTALFAAQVAVLRGEEAVYRSNLEYIQLTIERHYSNSSKEVSVFSEKVEQLIRTPVTMTVPDLSGSLNLLQEVISKTSVN